MTNKHLIQKILNETELDFFEIKPTKYLKDNKLDDWLGIPLKKRNYFSPSEFDYILESVIYESPKKKSVIDNFSKSAKSIAKSVIDFLIAVIF